MAISWLSLIPPFSVIAIAVITRRMNSAFFVGIVSAALIAMHGNLESAFGLTTKRLLETATNRDSLYLYAFLIAIGSLIVLFEVTGCVAALANFAVKKLQTKKGAELSSIGLSCLLFVDDYLSILTTGHVMRSITDRFGVPRQKVAFLIHSLAGSVVILAPISSWVAAITAQLAQAGIQESTGGHVQVIADPFFIYLQSLPFMFYSFLIIASVWFIVHFKISYGPMNTHEESARATSTAPTSTEQKHKLIDLVVPLVVLLVGMIGGLLYMGDYVLFGGNHSLIDALKYNSNPFFVMFMAGVASFVAGIMLALTRKNYSFIQVPKTIWGGVELMYGAILMVYFSSTLATMLKTDVCTGQYLALLLLGSVSTFLLPALFFIVSLLCALATGSAWGTFSLMLSIAVPMLVSLSGVAPLGPQAIVLLMPVLGAIFSGAVCGDHISPISETTIMAAASTNIEPLQHAYTQFPYALPAVISTFIAFLGAGLLIEKGQLVAIAVPLIFSCLLCFILIALLHKRSAKS
jgi:Na+/H+ antiporter NhaC